MATLIDTNVLLRSIESNHAPHNAAVSALEVLVSGIDRILTFNVQDFARYGGIQAVHPNEVLQLG